MHSGVQHPVEIVPLIPDGSHIVKLHLIRENSLLGLRRDQVTFSYFLDSSTDLDPPAVGCVHFNFQIKFLQLVVFIVNIAGLDTESELLCSLKVSQVEEFAAMLLDCDKAVNIDHLFCMLLFDCLLQVVFALNGIYRGAIIDDPLVSTQKAEIDQGPQFGAPLMKLPVNIDDLTFVSPQLIHLLAC